MGRIARLLSFVRTARNDAQLTDVKVNPGGGANITAEHYAPAGDDAHPLNSDYVALNNDSGTGRESAIGYLDPLNEAKTAPGEKRIYARDADTGVVVCEIWLKNDGSTTLSNDNGSVTLQPDGGVEVDNDSTVVVNCKNATINAASVDLGGSGGNGLITTASIDPFTGVPHIDGSTIVKAVK